jgi:hypothetical protein
MSCGRRYVHRTDLDQLEYEWNTLSGVVGTLTTKLELRRRISANIGTDLSCELTCQCDVVGTFRRRWTRDHRSEI